MHSGILFSYNINKMSKITCMYVNAALMFCILSWSLQYLMEGSYNKVFLAKGNIPAESYTFFIDILLDTIR